MAPFSGALITNAHDGLHFDSDTKGQAVCANSRPRVPAPHLFAKDLSKGVRCAVQHLRPAKKTHTTQSFQWKRTRGKIPLSKNTSKTFLKLESLTKCCSWKSSVPATIPNTLMTCKTSDTNIKIRTNKKIRILSTVSAMCTSVHKRAQACRVQLTGASASQRPMNSRLEKKHEY